MTISSANYLITEKLHPFVYHRNLMGGGGGAVVECPTRDRKVPGSIPGGAKK